MSRRRTDASKLSHVDAKGLPTMVDISGKAASAREANARCLVQFPPAIAAQLRATNLHSAKGPVLATAIVAGTQAVKRTHELIPFCHPLPIDGCRHRQLARFREGCAVESGQLVLLHGFFVLQQELPPLFGKLLHSHVGS